MAAEALQPFEALKGRTQPGHEANGADVTQVVRGERGEQEQPDVGGRRVRRNLAERRFLVVIRGQPVIVRPDKVLEEQPGAPRQAAQGDVLRLRDGRGGAPDRLADAQGDLGRQSPAEKQRQGHEQAGGPEPENEDADGRGEEHRAQHEAPHPPAAAGCGFALGGPRGGEPFQQAPAGDHHADQAGDDCLEHLDRFKGQKGDREKPTHAAHLSGSGLIAAMPPGWSPRTSGVNEPISAGTASAVSAASVQAQAAPGKSSQPTTSMSSSAGGSRLRRRLSRSFQVSISPKSALSSGCPLGLRRAATARAGAANRRASSDAAGAYAPGRWAGSPRTGRCR